MAKRKRDMQLNFRVSAEELAVIEQKMSQFGTSNREAYLRKMALDGYVVKLELPELKELVSLMRRSSNNLNQLTRKVHETGRVYQDTDLFVDESVDTAEQAIQNLLLEDLHQALLKLSPAERDFILSYYEMKIPNATCLAQRYGITRQAADKRLKKIEEKIKKLVAIF